MLNIKGKKILVIGGNPLDTEIVKRIQERGAIAVVADYYEDYDEAPAKILADEVWNIDWTDTQKLKEYCIESKVDGAISGFSEFKVEALINLTSEMGWPCYITKRQLDITSNKDKFKIECEKYGIPTVQQYKSIQDVDSFPVIVKPVDRGGSIGITVCYNIDELIEAYNKATRLSPSSNVIIEKYLGDLRKIDLYYVIQNGVPTLFSTSDTIMKHRPSKGLEILQLGWIYPSKHHKTILNSIDDKICNLLKGLEIDNGYITISGFIDKNYNIYIFETGLRLSGELSYKRLEQITGSNYLDMFIDLAIFGKTETVNYVSGERQKDYMLVENFYINNGKISNKIENVSDQNTEYIDLLFNNRTIDYNGNLLPKSAMIFICAKDKKTLVENVKHANNNYDIVDKDQKSMLAFKPTIEDIKQYFESTV